MVKHLVTMRCDISTRSTKGTTALDTSKKKRRYFDVAKFLETVKTSQQYHA